MPKRIVIFPPIGKPISYAQGHPATVMSFNIEQPIERMVSDIHTNDSELRVNISFEGSNDRLYYKGLPYSLVELVESPPLRPIEELEDLGLIEKQSTVKESETVDKPISKKVDKKSAEK